MRYIRSLVAVVFLATSFAAVSDDHDKPSSTPTSPKPSPPDVNASLPAVAVKPQQDPLSRSDRRVKRLQKSLPLSDGNRLPDKDLTDRLHDYVARHSDPDDSTAEERKMMGRTELPPGAIPDASSENSPQQ